jgi:hypothetical protein
MSDLVCVAHKERDTADKVLNELRRLQVEHLIDLGHSAISGARWWCSRPSWSVGRQWRTRSYRSCSPQAT